MDCRLNCLNDLLFNSANVLAKKKGSQALANKFNYQERQNIEDHSDETIVEYL